MGNCDPDNTFLKCCCHTTVVGLGNFPVQLGSQIANSFLKEGHLPFCFPKSHLRLLFTLHCQPLPSCVALSLPLCLCSLQPQLISHPPSVRSKKNTHFASYHKTKSANFILLKPRTLSIIEAVHLKALLKLMYFKSPEKK